ncbi:MAG: hypothetical protein J1G04_06940, partial [Clostridiales bacterium]|nr:hypothetical protein [Clostridiales bacterium]
TLTLTDGAGTGKISGGYNNQDTESGTIYAYGGGVYVYKGTLNIEGGSIEGNKVEQYSNAAYNFGGGVCVRESVLNMSGGRIADNECVMDPALADSINSYKYGVGGGIGVRATGTVNISGKSVIENNSALNGGAIGGYAATATATLAASNVRINISGGTFQNNKAVVYSTVPANKAPNEATKEKYNLTDEYLATIKSLGAGGAIGSFGPGFEIDVKGGEFRYNTAGLYGGAISMIATAKIQSRLGISGDTNIHHNVVATRYGEAVGGAISLKTPVSSLKGETNLDEKGNPVSAIKATISGGKIEHNYAICSFVWEKDAFRTNSGAYAGGINIQDGSVTIMTGGKVAYNRAASIADPLLSKEDFESLIYTLMHDEAYDDVNLTRKYKTNEEGNIIPANKDGAVSDVTKADRYLYEDGDDTLIVDGAVSMGGAVVSYISDGAVYDTPNIAVYGHFEISGDAEISHNRAASGGAVNLRYSYLNLYGGKIVNNYGHHGAVYAQAGGRTFLSGNPIVKDNISNTGICKSSDITGDEADSNLEVIYASTDKRQPSVTGSLEDGAEVHIFAPVDVIAYGAPVTQNYGKHNRLYVPLVGENTKEVPQNYDPSNTDDGVVVYANPYRYFVSDDVYAIASGASYNDKPENISYQHFVVNDDGEVGISGGIVVFTVKFNNGSEKTFEYGNKYNVTEDNNWNFVATTYGDDVYPVSIDAKVYARKPDVAERDFYAELGYKIAEDFKPTGSPEEGVKYYLVWDNTDEKTKEFGDPTPIGNGTAPEAGVYSVRARFNPEKIAFSKTVDGSNPTTMSNIAPMYASFYVIVKAKPLTTDDVQISLWDEHDQPLTDTTYSYDGLDKEPKVEYVKYGDLTLVNGTDYEVSYRDNKNAGKKATVVITFIGNYAGEALAYFTIGASKDTSTMTEVTWQVKVNGEWVNLTDANYNTVFTFIPDASNGYEAVDQRADVRALLVAGDLKQAVYAYGIVVEDSDEDDDDAQDVYTQNTSMYLRFESVAYADTESGDAFGNAGTYTVRIIGDSNYPIDENADRAKQIVMKKMALAVTADDYSQYESDGQRLWKLVIGSGDDAVIGELLTTATYVEVDDNGKETVIPGTSNVDMFARYRGVPLSLVINGNYTFEGVGLSIAELMAMADSYSYTPTQGVIGAEGKTSALTTELVIRFGANYALTVDGKSVTEISIVKPWKIVTMYNTLLHSDGREITSNNFGVGWTFGEIMVNSYEFRPEHGNTVIYSYYYVTDDGEEFVTKFALVYENDSVNSNRDFYAMNDDGK